MSALHVRAPGISSIQDAGRYGLQRYGVAPAGAMDLGSLALGNLLVGNDPRAAALEIGPIPATFRIEQAPARIAVTGASRILKSGQLVKPDHQTFIVAPGEELELGSAHNGTFSYLCIEGSFKVVPHLGSNSIDERAGLGRPFARRIQRNDILEIGTAGPRRAERRSQPPIFCGTPIRVIMGPQDDHFFPETLNQFLDSTWRIAHKSDRMCFRLDGPLLAHARGYNIVSDATVKGSIQIAGSGQPYVLMADRGTTGGYPKIAAIATIDIDRFAQCPPGTEIRFQAISLLEAQSLLQKIAMPPRLELLTGLPLIDIDALHIANLAGEVTDARADDHYCFS